MRYHLWLTHSSRRGSHGVLDSHAVTGAPGLSPTTLTCGSGGCSKVYSPNSLSPISLTWGLSGQGFIWLLFLFLAVVTHYHRFTPLSTTISCFYKI